jgi:hypothetical protein
MASDDDTEPVQDLNLTEDLELAKAMEEAYMTPPQTDDGDNDSLCAFYVPYQYNQRGKTVAEPTPESTPTQLREAYEQAEDDRYADYGPEPIQSAVQGAFTMGRAVKDKRLHQRNLPDKPKSIRDLENHPLQDRFIEAQKVHLESHKQMKSWTKTDKVHARGLKVINSMWTFVYKTDKHGYL